MIHCAMVVDRMGMLGGSVGQLKALTVKVERVTLTGIGRQHLTCFVYEVYAISSEVFFLTRLLFLGGHLRFG